MPWSQKKSYYFCENCKISGHSIERCFKIHGYPGKNKTTQTRKYAAAAHSDALEILDENNKGKQYGMNSEQFSKLLNFLGKAEKQNDDITKEYGGEGSLSI